jgi:hypothetical protein
MPRKPPNRGGAPKGNTNAMKHGARSRRMLRALDKIIADDDIRAFLDMFTTLTPDEARRYHQTIAARAHMLARRNARARPQPRPSTTDN